MSDSQHLTGQEAYEQVIAQLKQEIQALKDELKQERFKTAKLNKRVLFLGTHCDALSKLLEGERA